MNWLEKIVLKRVIRHVVLQGNQKHKITEFYRLITKAAREHYTEDNKPTLDQFLTECHTDSLDGFE